MPGGIAFSHGGGGASTWLSLTDTPSSFSGKAGQYVRVKTGDAELEFTAASTAYTEVANYSALPAAADHSGEIYVCLAAEGTFLISRKRAGLWYSNGSAWSRLGNAITLFDDANFTIYDNGDNSKKIKFQASGITASNTRTITMPDANVDLTNLVQVKVDVAATAGYLGVAYNDGVLRSTQNVVTITDGGNYITLGLADHNDARTALGLAIGTDVLAEQTVGIADDNLLEVDGSPNDDEYARFTANGLEGRTEGEFKSDFSLVIGTDVLAEQTIGISDDNLLEVDGSPNDDEYARFTANGLEGRTAAEVMTDLPAATTTAPGKSELAINTEVDTGTDATRAVTPDALAGSTIFGTKTVILKVVADDTAPTAGDGKMYFTVPVELNGMNLVTVGAHVYTASGGSGPVNVMIHNLTDTADMLSTAITIDDTEVDSATAGTAAVIDTGEDDVVTADIIRIDVDDIGDASTRGLEIRMGFRLP